MCKYVFEYRYSLWISASKKYIFVSLKSMKKLRKKTSKLKNACKN